MNPSQRDVANQSELDPSRRVLLRKQRTEGVEVASAANPPALAHPKAEALAAEHLAAMQEAQARAYAQGIQQAERELAETKKRLTAEYQNLAEQLQQQTRLQQAQNAKLLTELQAEFARSQAVLADRAGDWAVDLACAALISLLEPAQVQRGAVQASVANAMEVALPLRPVKLRLHPADLALLGPVNSQGLEWQADATLQRGSCVVDTEQGEVLASMAERLMALARTWSGNSAAVGDGELIKP